MKPTICICCGEPMFARDSKNENICVSCAQIGAQLAEDSQPAQTFFAQQTLREWTTPFKPLRHPLVA